MLRRNPASMHEPTRAILKEIPSGPRGTRATLREMAKLVRRYRVNPRIRELALDVVRPVPGHKNFRGQVAALHNFVRSNIQYVRDVNGVETLQTPAKTLEYGQGDCDDQSTLLATLLETVGFRARFRAIKIDASGPFCHVFSEVSLGRGWVPLETTERWPMGTEPPRVAASMIENI